MSRRPSPVYAFPCPRCLAPAGKHCTTSSGKYSPAPHAARTSIVRADVVPRMRVLAKLERLGYALRREEIGGLPWLETSWGTWIFFEDLDADGTFVMAISDLGHSHPMPMRRYLLSLVPTGRTETQVTYHESFEGAAVAGARAFRRSQLLRVLKHRMQARTIERHCMTLTVTHDDDGDPHVEVVGTFDPPFWLPEGRSLVLRLRCDDLDRLSGFEIVNIIKET